jgi:hypothetical protein
MNDQQRETLKEILSDTWSRYHSSDEAFDMVEELINEIRASAQRAVE